MENHHRCPFTVSTMVPFLLSAGTRVKQAVALGALLVTASFGSAQDSTPPDLPQPQIVSSTSFSSSVPMLPSLRLASLENIPRESPEPTPGDVIVSAGTRIVLVLTHPIQSRNVRRGDDIYAQITAPVTSGNEVAIPPGTFVQGKVDKLASKSGRAEIRLQSISITYPDGYVAPISGPITLESDSGYALKDPGNRRAFGAIALPLAGGGLGGLIGHSAGTASSTVTTPFPPGCVGGPPFCSTTSMQVPGSQLKDTAMGASIGGAAGAIAAIALLVGSHHFFLDVGSPLDLVLTQPLRLDQDRVTQAVEGAEKHPVAEQPIAPRPVPPPPPPYTDHGTCYTPGTPGTPPTVIPGAPGPDGIPGPPITIPGTPPTPGAPYPCP